MAANRRDNIPIKMIELYKKVIVEPSRILFLSILEGSAYHCTKSEIFHYRFLQSVNVTNNNSQNI